MRDEWMSLTHTPSGIELFKHQVETAQFLYNGGKMTWDEMGTGKTFALLKADEMVLSNTTLIVHPNIARGMWEKEIKTYWGTDPYVHVITKSKDKLFHNGRRPRFTLVPISLVQSLKNMLTQFKYDTIIHDEGHHLKSMKSWRKKAMYGARKPETGIAYSAKRFWSATGTPMPNDPSELYPHLRALAPELILKDDGSVMTFTDFINRYCYLRSTSYGTKISGGKDLKDLRERTKKFAIRHTLKEVFPNMPPVTFDEERVGLDVKQKAALARQIEELELEPDFEYWPMEAHATVQKLTGALKLDHAEAYLREAFEDGLENIVVFFTNVVVGEGLQARLNKLGISSSLVYGGTKDREEEIRKFQAGETKVFLANISVASTAINLQNSHRVLFVQQDWVPGNNVQALRRCARYGQEKTVQVTTMHMTGTLDEDITRSLTGKLRVIVEVVGEDSF